MKWFNNHTIHKQDAKLLLSGTSPQCIYDLPHHYGLKDLHVSVPQQTINELRMQLGTPREEAFRWVSDEFDAMAFQVYQDIGAPSLNLLNAWNIFNEMVKYIEEMSQ